jgi:hypothetical protein
VVEGAVRKTWEKKIVPFGFSLAGALFLFAAVVPALEGDPLNAAFLGVGALFLILGIATWRKASQDSGPPRG